MKTSELIKWYEEKIKQGFYKEEIDSFLEGFEESSNINPYLLTGDELKRALEQRQRGER